MQRETISSITSWRMSLMVSETSAPHQVAALLVDHLALIVHHVVEAQQCLADVEVARFDLALGLLDRLVDPGVDDRFAFFQAQLLQHAVHPLGPEDAHQIVFQRLRKKSSARDRPGARAAAQLVVDAPAFVTFGAQNVEPAGGQTFSRSSAIRHRSLGLARASASSSNPPVPADCACRALPPSWMSVPRPAMLVAIVTRRDDPPGRRCWLPVSW